MRDAGAETDGARWGEIGARKTKRNDHGTAAEGHIVSGMLLR